jgi:hypothetical protein
MGSSCQRRVGDPHYDKLASRNPPDALVFREVRPTRYNTRRNRIHGNLPKPDREMEESDA